MACTLAPTRGCVTGPAGVQSRALVLRPWFLGHWRCGKIGESGGWRCWVGQTGVWWKASWEVGPLLGKLVGSFVSSDVCMAWYPVEMGSGEFAEGHEGVLKLFD